MKNGWKQILVGVVTVLLLGVWSTVAFAHEVPVLNCDGSISVSMQYEGKVVSGGNLTIYHVGEVREDDGNYFFAYCEDFVECGYSLDNVKSQTLVNQLVDYVKDKNIRGTTMEIASDGKLSFEGLEPGVYLFIQTKAADGYEKVNPFLVTIPLTVDGKYIYNVDASPKLELIKQNIPSTTTSVTPSTTGSITPISSKLPQTGQLNWPIQVLSFSGLLLFVIGWVLKYRERKTM